RRTLQSHLSSSFLRGRYHFSRSRRLRLTIGRRRAERERPSFSAALSSSARSERGSMVTTRSRSSLTKGRLLFWAIARHDTATAHVVDRLFDVKNKGLPNVCTIK